jgi:hypothetical protein
MIEPLAYVALLAALATRPAFRATLGALPPARRAYLIALVLALVAGHLASRGAAREPLGSRDASAASRPRAARFYDYTVIRRSGREEPLPVARVFPGLSLRLVHRLRALADELAEMPQGPARSARLASYARLLGVIARRHDAPDALDPVEAVQVWQVTVEGGAGAPGRVTRQRLWLVTVVPLA